MKKLIILIVIAACCLGGCSKKTATQNTTATQLNVTTSAQVETTAPDDGICTVNFLSYDGKSLSVQNVEFGQPITAPEPPEWTGRSFIGWDRNLERVCSDMTVRPLYIPTTEAAISVVSISAAPGEAVTVPVAIVRNPGIAGAKITIVYDSALTLNDGKSGPVFSALDYTGPGKYSSPCNFTWDSESGEATENGDVLYLTFTVPEGAVKGQCYEVRCTYQDGSIYDEELQNVQLHVFNGTITVI